MADHDDEEIRFELRLLIRRGRQRQTAHIVRRLATLAKRLQVIWLTVRRFL